MRYNLTEVDNTIDRVFMLVHEVVHKVPLPIRIEAA